MPTSVFIGGPKDGLEVDIAVGVEWRFPLPADNNPAKCPKMPPPRERFWVAKYTYDKRRTMKAKRPVYVFDGYEEM